MSQKCEGNCGLWVLDEIIEKIYPIMILLVSTILLGYEESL
jgi:hypothetical protein